MPDATYPHVHVAHGVYILQLDANRALPFLFGGKPLSDLGENWQFHRLSFDLAPVLCFELKNQDGSYATWFFNSTPAYLGNTITGLSDEVRIHVLRKCAEILRNVMAPMLGMPYQQAGGWHGRFSAMSPPMRQEIVRLLADTVLPPATATVLEDVPTPLFLSAPALPTTAIELHRARLQVILEQDFQSRLLVALQEGQLTWPGLAGDLPTACSGSVALTDYDFAYRFQDAASGLVYFLLTTHHGSQLCGLYVPSEGLLLARDKHGKTVLQERFQNIARRFVDYACHYGDDLARYFSSGRKAVCGFMREQHIGHQLWNELSALDRLVKSVDAAQFPELLILGGRDSEFFGPIEEIFPEFAGKTRPNLVTINAITDYAHAHGLVMARFATFFVSKELRERLLSRARRLQNAEASDGPQSSGRTIVLGLRVENRTAVDLAGVLCRLLDHIALIAPGSHVIMDGQNRREGDAGKPLGSFGSFKATASPIDVEYGLFEQVSESIAGKAVRLSTTTGETVTKSLQAIDKADCFIAFWGAGMAKYRWVGNKPGFVLSSRYHLLNPAEMTIYQLPIYMDDPTPITYVDPANIQDDPDATQLVAVDGERHVSFRIVDEATFHEQVGTFLASLPQAAA